MNKFLTAGVLGALLFTLQVVSYADEAKAPLVTRDNFGGLILSSRMEQTSHVKSVSKDGEFTYSHSAPYIRQGLPATGKFSELELDEIFKVINQANLPSLDVRYCYLVRDYGWRDFTLRVSTDKTPPFELFNDRFASPIIPKPGTYLDTPVPDVYLKFWQSLNTIFEVKFLSQSFTSLTLETIEGLTDILSAIEIRALNRKTPEVQYSITWTQTEEGKNIKHTATLKPTEVLQTMQLIHAARIHKLYGASLNQQKLRGKTNEVLTLDLGSTPLSLINHGDVAQTEYSALTKYLRDLAEEKSLVEN